MKVRLTQIDGKFPNLALMKLAHWHKAKGDDVYFERSISMGFFEPEYDTIYGSAIFSTSGKKIEMFKANFPSAIIGGTAVDITGTVEQVIGEKEYEHYDYSIYPHFTGSIGFTQRGCRLKCPFCVVPKKEGKNIGVNSIYDIWRGEEYPKEIHLLDNDFFGQEHWRERSKEIIDGGFKVSFNQGINIRLIHQEGAEALAKMKYYDDQFKKRRIYTAWDNKKDEKRFFSGIKLLTDAGINPNHIMVYMLCGYWPGETFEDVYYRFEKMKDLGLMPYPMVYGENKHLKKFQQWVVRRYYQFTNFEQFCSETETDFARRKSTANNYTLFNS